MQRDDGDVARLLITLGGQYRMMLSAVGPSGVLDGFGAIEDHEDEGDEHECQHDIQAGVYSLDCSWMNASRTI